MRVCGSHPPLSSPNWEGCRADCCDVVRETMTRSHLGTATRSTATQLYHPLFCSLSHLFCRLCPSGENHVDKSFLLLHLFCFIFCFIFFIFFTSSHLHIFLLPFHFHFHLYPPRRDDEFLAVLLISVTTGAEGEAWRGAGRQHADKADGSCDASTRSTVLLETT